VMLGFDGTMRESFGSRGTEPGQFNFPTNIARAADGRLFVTDSMNFRVQIFDADGQYVRAFGRVGDGWGDFNKPKGVAVDSNGHIYVVEGLNDVVQIFDDTGHLLLVFGGSGTGSGQLWLPSGIAIVNDVVYVADAANRRVQMFEYVKDRP
jgi:DNA-binding beta-propeller fold protein YncE